MRRTLLAALLVAASCTSATPTSERVRGLAITPSPTPVPIVTVRYRVDVRVGDAPDFAQVLAETMSDRRGWIRAGFVLQEASDAPYTVVLAEGPVAHQLCLPYDVGGEFSCQNGPVVVINVNRWRMGVPHWPLGLPAYRAMLLNHEMGHLLGQRHVSCPRRRADSPVMAQQSGGLGGCRANVWPTDAEIARAARHDLKLAPAYGE